ncbi:MAG: hypothetical protein ACREQ4_12940, partial [Candidatus Binataceae bacterium]
RASARGSRINSRGHRIEGSAMTLEELNQLQQQIGDGRTLALEQCGAAVGEIWRLRTALTSKAMEADYWRDSCDQLKLEIDKLRGANDLLQSEIDLLHAVRGLTKCALENRWSNCAVRMKKRERR